MEDLFEREQHIYDNSVKHLEEIQNGDPFSIDEFINLVKEYGRLLKQLRRVTKISDRTTVDLNASKLDLLDKVYYDALTGIYNRRFIEERLKIMIKSMAKTGNFLSVLMLDIDYFKKYNDTYGHSAGDECLKIVANAINNDLLRADDFVARYGGEEFLVVLPDTDADRARYVAGRLLEDVRACNIQHEKSDVAECVTISIGVTTNTVSYGKNSIYYIDKADEALYLSKQNGRNRYTFVEFEEGTK